MTDDKTAETTPKTTEQTVKEKAREVYLSRLGWKLAPGPLPDRWTDPNTGTVAPVEEAERVALRRQTITMGHWLHRLSETASPDVVVALGAQVASLGIGALKAFAEGPDFAPAMVTWLKDPDVHRLWGFLRTMLRPSLRAEIKAILAEDLTALLAARTKPPAPPPVADSTPRRRATTDMTALEDMGPDDRAAHHLSLIVDALMVGATTLDSLISASFEETPRAAVERDLARLVQARAVRSQLMGDHFHHSLTAPALEQVHAIGALAFARGILEQTPPPPAS